MTTTSPSWFPSWPSDFPDIQQDYEQTVPEQYPAGLYEPGSDEYKDIQATAQVFSWIAQGSMWIRRRLWPHFDTSGLFLDLWEDAFGLVARSSITERVANITRSARNKLGTATKANVQAIFAPVFGDNADPSTVAFASPSSSDIAANPPDSAEGWARALNSMHIYDANETTEPDRVEGTDAVNATKPTYQRWTYGRYNKAKWDTQGTWDHACWS
jgi:hypothetical protein